MDHSRTVVTPSGVVARRFVALEARVQWNLTPPRMRIEEAVVDVAAEAVDDYSAIAILADAVQARRTTPERLSALLRGRHRVARRTFLEDVLRDVGAGACSALEHAYLTRVERPHGLPTGWRQVKASSRGPVYRDVHYAGLGFLVELDGRLDHTRVRDRDRDLDRDLDAALDELLTVRLGWGQAVGRPCETAKKVARLLQRRGWTGSPRRCKSCPAEDPVVLEPPGDSRSTRSAVTT